MASHPQTLAYMIEEHRLEIEAREKFIADRIQALNDIRATEALILAEERAKAKTQEAIDKGCGADLNGGFMEDFKAVFGTKC